MQSWMYLLICNLLWAGNFISGKIAVAEFSPVWITVLRWTLAALILFPAGHYLEKFPFKTIDRKTWLLLLLMGVFGISLFALLTYSALEYTSPINISLVNALTPAIAMLLSAVFMKKATTRQQLLGLLLGFSGVVIIITHGDFAKILSLSFNKGDLIMLAADFCWVFYTMLGKRLSHLPSITTTAISSALGVMMMIPLAAFEPMSVGPITLVGIGSILYIGLGASVLAFVLWNAALREVDITLAGISMNLIPIYTVIITTFMGNPFAGPQLWGGMLVLFGMLLITLQKQVMRPAE